MALILQFWIDEASVPDGELFGGRVHPASALVEYMMSTMNPVLEPGFKVSWDDIIIRTPWMNKRLYNSTSEEDCRIRHQALLVAGTSSPLEVAMERCYGEFILNAAAQAKKKASQQKPGPKPSPAPKPSGSGTGRNHKDPPQEDCPGQDWTHVPPKDQGPDVGK